MTISVQERSLLREAAAQEIQDRLGRVDALEFVTRWDEGLTLLRNTLYTRIRTEQPLGSDSMLVPVSENRTEQLAKGEIELFMLAEAFSEVTEGGYLKTDIDWMSEWLSRLRLRDKRQTPIVAERFSQYLQQKNDHRHLFFSNLLERSLPEARRAPLVLYRLFPLAVRVTTALAFGDHLRAAELRNKQIAIHNYLAECRACLGRPLDVEESCKECGNPVWKFRWLTID